MLKTVIKETAMTTNEANRYFESRINVPSWHEDVAMQSAMRILFDRRIKDGETIRLVYDHQFVSDHIENLGQKINEYKKAKHGFISVLPLNCRKDATGKWVDDAKKQLEEAGLFEIPDVTAKMSEHGPALVYTNVRPDPKDPRSVLNNTKTIVLMENLTIARWHCLVVMIRRLLGKWFSEMPLTDAEKNMVLSLSKDDQNGFLAACQAYADTLDLRSAFIRSALADFDTRFEKERASGLERQIRDIDREMDSLFTRIGEYMNSRDELQATLWGYQNGMHKTEPVTMNYFLANKNIHLVAADASHIEYYTVGWFDNWDPAKAKSTFGQNHMSSWLDYCEQYDVSREDATMLYKAIFLSESVKVRFWSHFAINMHGGSDPLSVYGHGEKLGSIMNALPNPHHQYNSCGGEHRRLVADAMRKHNLIGAIEQSFMATKGVNLTEQVSYRNFARDLFDPQYGEVVWVNAESKFMTTKDAIKYLKEHEQKA